MASKSYRKRYGSYDRRGKIKNRVSIDERPAIVDRRNRISDWEGDTIVGKRRQSALLTMVERKTLDNGLEYADHDAIAQGLEANIYFAHPYASWQRGINENTNGLIRQYFPKGTDFNEVSDMEIDFVMNRLNIRPRATRGSRSPNELFMGRRVDLLAA